MIFYPTRRANTPARRFNTPRPMVSDPGDATQLTWMLKSFVMGITLLGLSYWLVQIAGVQYLASLTSATLMAFLLTYVVWCLLHKKRLSRQESSSPSRMEAGNNSTQGGASETLTPTPPPPFDHHQAYKFNTFLPPRDSSPPPTYEEAVRAMLAMASSNPQHPSSLIYTMSSAPPIAPTTFSALTPPSTSPTSAHGLPEYSEEPAVWSQAASPMVLYPQSTSEINLTVQASPMTSVISDFSISSTPQLQRSSEQTTETSQNNSSQTPDSASSVLSESEGDTSSLRQLQQNSDGLSQTDQLTASVMRSQNSTNSRNMDESSSQPEQKNSPQMTSHDLSGLEQQSLASQPSMTQSAFLPQLASMSRKIPSIASELPETVSLHMSDLDSVPESTNMGQQNTLSSNQTSISLSQPKQSTSESSLQLSQSTQKSSLPPQRISESQTCLSIRTEEQETLGESEGRQSTSTSERLSSSDGRLISEVQPTITNNPLIISATSSQEQTEFALPPQQTSSDSASSVSVSSEPNAQPPGTKSGPPPVSHSKSHLLSKSAKDSSKGQSSLSSKTSSLFSSASVTRPREQTPPPRPPKPPSVFNIDDVS